MNMNISLRIKLLFMCIVLVLLAATGMSVTYYRLTTASARRESRQRLQIAVALMLHELSEHRTNLIARFDDFLNQDARIQSVGVSYTRNSNALTSSRFVVSDLGQQAGRELRNFGRIVQMNEISLYAADGRLLVIYRHQGAAETLGVYITSSTGQDTYLPIDDLTELLKSFSERSIPDIPLPEGVVPSFDGDIPDATTADWFVKDGRVGILLTAPMYYSDKKVGVLVGHFFYTKDMISGPASLSQTSINVFAGVQFHAGTLPEQQALPGLALKTLPSCDSIVRNSEDFELLTRTFQGKPYYQAQCTLTAASGPVGAITASFPQSIEKEETQKILVAVVVVSGIVIVIAFVFFWVFSRPMMLAIQNIVDVLGAAAEGDLRQDAQCFTHDEIGMLAQKLNQMIAQFRRISLQVQGASFTVNSTADTIFQQMDNLILHMEQQAGSVDGTTLSIEKISAFIDTVADNTNELLASTSQSLAAVQETRASVNEITSSTDHLNVDLQQILTSVDQTNQTVKHISQHTEDLTEVAQHTGTEIHHIDQLLVDVSHNASQTEQLAQQTMNAATSAETSVEASLQGMTDLMKVVANIADIIGDVRTRGERVSSILDIVDEITGQTALLSLNASIISAQAGVHGRGFAVVAEEIKELATRTAASTKEIGTLIRELQQKTEEGVHHTAEGLQKAERSVNLTHAVKEALATILEHATRSSKGAADTAELLQQSTNSSQAITSSMTSVTDMAANIRAAIQEHKQDISQVVAAVERISGMAEQVSRAGGEQKRSVAEIERSMQSITERFGGISVQTEELRQNSQQIVDGMHIIENTTTQILDNVTEISDNFVKNLIQQADVLQQSVKVFKVS